MSDRTESKIKFVNLHGHSVAGSILMDLDIRKSTWILRIQMDVRLWLLRTMAI